MWRSVLAMPWVGVLLLLPPPVSADAVPFDAGNSLATLSGAVSVAAGDLDGDGDLDLLVGGQGSGVRRLTNDGTDAAWPSITVDAGFDTRHLALADLDGDGDLDAIGAPFTGTLTWWENTGGGAWPAVELEISAGVGFEGAFGVAAGDVDGDGDLDLVATNGLLYWFENDAGDGSSWTAIDIGATATVSGAIRPALADFDADGDLDVVTAGGSGPSSVCWYENAGGAASWTRHEIATALADTVSHASAADLDRDGDLDVVASIGSDDGVGGELAWFEADGTRHDLDTDLFRTQWSAAADLDRDGDLDVLASSWPDGPTPGRLAWYENTDGAGAFGAATDIGASIGNGMQGVIADLDGDGDPDAALARFGDVLRFENLTLHRGARFNLEPPVAAPPHREVIDGSLSNLYHVRAGDIDCDGDADLVVASYTTPEYLAWWENPALGGGSWTSHSISSDPTDVRGDLALGDLDGDGDLDVVLGAFAELGWYRNPGCGSGSWSLFGYSELGYTLTQLALGDIDRDGDLDVALGLSAGSNAAPRVWWENDGNPNPIGWTEHVISSGVHSILDLSDGALADLDGDGDLDLIGPGSSISGGSPELGVWLLDDGAVSSAVPIVTTVGNLRSIAVADFDGDGDVDLAGVGTASDDAAWWENAGTGASWTEHPIATDVVTSVRRTQAADLDADGDADLLISDSDGNRVRWIENLGGGAFAGSAQSLAVSFDGARGFDVADLDLDGDLDVAASAQGLSTLAWFANRGGQLALPTADAVASASPLEGATDVALLRIDGLHRGRAGDDDAELATLELLFEESPGDVLTTGQLDNLVDTLRLFLDDGDDVFEPGIQDGELFAQGALSLVAGVQTLTMIDGGTGVQLLPATAGKSWWLAADLAAAAGNANPGSFRVSHLVTASSTGEMRSTDLPLDLEHLQADVASTTITPLDTRTLTVTVAGTGAGHVTSSPAGIDCGTGGADCSEGFAVGAVVTLTAVPATGSNAVVWSGTGCSGSVTMSANRSCTATFTLQTRTLTVETVGNGHVGSTPAGIDCGSDCEQSYDYGTSVTLTPTPDSGWSFAGWSEDADCADGEVTMTAARACTATFSLDGVDRTLEVTVVGTGNVVSTPAGIDCGDGATDCTELFADATPVTLTPEAAAGWLFGGWSGDTDCADGDLTMSADRACTATFLSEEIFVDGFEIGDGLSAWSVVVP